MARQLQALRTQPGFDAALRGLDNPSSALRCEAAHALGSLDAPLAGAAAGLEACAALHRRARIERCDHVRFSLFLALARLGGEGPEGPSRAACLRRRVRWYATPEGPREVARSLSWSSARDALLWSLALGEESETPPDRAARLRRQLEGAPEDRALWTALALQRQPADLARIVALQREQGRIAMLVPTLLGLHGDPRAQQHLRGMLRPLDLPPARSLVARDQAAEAIGRLGLRTSGPALKRALEQEAQSHEGRPGAGMGVQRPVRKTLLHALGEVGDPSQLPAIFALFADRRGVPGGGLYLVAMDAAWKLDAEQTCRDLVRRADAVTAAHALGVVVACRGPEAAKPWRADPRPEIQAVIAAGAEIAAAAEIEGRLDGEAEPSGSGGG